MMLRKAGNHVSGSRCQPGSATGMAERSGYGHLPCLVHRRLPGLGLLSPRPGPSLAWRGSSRRPCGTPVRVSASAKAASGGLTSRIAALLSRPGPWTLPRIRVVLPRERTRRRRQDLNRALQLGHLAPELPDPLEATVVTPGAWPSSTPAWRIHLRSVCRGHPQPPGHRGDRGVLRGIITGVIAHQPDRLGLGAWSYLTGMNVPSFPRNKVRNSGRFTARHKLG
jgi:hypothetical protein